MCSASIVLKSLRRKQVAIFCGCVLLAVWLIPYSYLRYRTSQDGPEFSFVPPPYLETPASPSPSADHPIPSQVPDLSKQNESVEIPDITRLYSYNEDPIRDLCERAPWADGANVVVNCEARVGGIGNVRQEVLQCVRLAIEIGAGLIRPSIRIRSEGLIEYQSGEVTEFEYLFDTLSFESRLNAACPRMPLFKNLEDVERIGNISRKARPWFLPDDEDGRRISFSAWTDQNRAAEGEITVIDLPLTMGQGQVCDDGAPFVNSFGGLVEFREDAKLLAVKILSELSNNFDDKQSGSLDPHNSPFVGVHLRTADDAINAGYASYDIQASNYLEIIKSRSSSVVYAASGNDSSLDQFTHDAAALSPPVTVMTKRSLLSFDDLMVLGNMTWDQQAIVDFLVLQQSSYFAGITESSFAWGIAYARQVISSSGTCVDKMESLPEGVLYEDEFSMIFGDSRDFFWGKVWP